MITSSVTRIASRPPLSAFSLSTHRLRARRCSSRATKPLSPPGPIRFLLLVENRCSYRRATRPLLLLKIQRSSSTAAVNSSTLRPPRRATRSTVSPRRDENPRQARHWSASFDCLLFFLQPWIICTIGFFLLSIATSTFIVFEVKLIV